MKRLERLHTDDDGIGLVEVLVALLLISVVGATTLGVLTSVINAERFTDEYSKVMDDGRISLDNIRRELREGRRVYATSTPHHLYWWADRNQDGLQQAEEQINYCVAPLATNSCVTSVQTGKFRLIRWSDAESISASRTIASTLTSTDVFSNFGSPVTDTKVVELGFKLDVRDGGSGPEEIQMGASVRLRNVG